MKGIRRRMVYGLYQSAAGLQTQEYRQAIIANNLANVDTPGFKPDRITFQERLAESLVNGTPRTRHPVLDALPGGLFESPVYTDYAQSGFETDAGPLDVALAGNGFLTLKTDEGRRYTRDGRMVIDRDGTLRHAATGSPLLDDQGRTIQLERTALDKVQIDDLGRIRQGEALVAELAIVDFKDKSALVKTGGNLIDANGQKPIASTAAVMQNTVETSGVDSVTSLVEMIEATRQYQLNANLLTLQDESLGRAVNDVGRIG